MQVLSTQWEYVPLCGGCQARHTPAGSQGLGQRQSHVNTARSPGLCGSTHFHKFVYCLRGLAIRAPLQRWTCGLASRPVFSLTRCKGSLNIDVMAKADSVSDSKKTLRRLLASRISMAHPGYKHLWQQAEMADTSIVICVAEDTAPAGDEGPEGQGSTGTVLQQFPAHIQILSPSPYFVAQASTDVVCFDVNHSFNCCE